MTLTTGTSQGLLVGVVAIVMLGAGGQVLRGIGELRSSTTLKATGYFLGLTNAAHLLPNR
jgi:hypothetical protein